MNGRLDETKEGLGQAQENYDQLMAAVGGRGGVREELELVWHELGADISAWQHNFCRNQTMKLLQEKAIEKYIDVFPITSSLHHLKKFLVSLGHIAKLCVARVLSDREIDELDEHTVNYYSR
ncbi:hypothetical protein B9Z55_001297 [Caenorhabditis nigoni]|uniref:Uncharacterized protein n=1 Tax=Caenorhabditis nigoni TaxID=1611254 RepID=A0A2G5VF49_9PELO|nr:hypothetical protein B9Z55_001297 [Caenorhabditis nigoni]